ncbi:MAG: glutamate 5-kinase [Candidatus Calescibacterium sp.]|nr:glutamate 5-kinase [Candidatus Calescibacterium sp.]MDW8087186.1 glutamate 5-kinase [Candidatus Calescibacterium sp.]
MITTIKVGSGVLDNNGKINDAVFETVAEEIAQRIRKNEKFIIVSSGALLMGLMKLGLARAPREIKKRQAICAIGQPTLMKKWDEAFSKHNIKVSQILITHEDIGVPKRAKNIEDTISEIFKIGAIPIINENDTVSTEEIRFGDNDFLSAYISALVGAKRLIIITDIDGVIDKHGNIIKEIHTDEIEQIWERISQKKTKKKVSSGGIISKLTSSKIASEFGIECYIINGRKLDSIKSAIKGENPGTKIFGNKIYSRKELWILRVMRGKGKIFVDKGAYDALRKGKSLLPAGIVDVKGNFSAGDLVEVYYENKLVGKGISNYFSSEVNLIKNRKTHEIENILGYKRFDEIIHRDNFVEQDR